MARDDDELTVLSQDSQKHLPHIRESEVSLDQKNHFCLNAEDAIETLGISAFCLFDTSGKNLCKLLLLAVQCIFLQYSVLYFLAKQLIPWDEKELKSNHFLEQDLDRWILLVAVYLHIVNCLTDLPFGFVNIRHLCHLKVDCLERAVTTALFFVDSIATPCCTLTIGSFYLCTSGSVSDLILNSCAVAFITNIDNWVLSLNYSMNKMEGSNRDDEIYLPHSKACMVWFNWVLCLVPVVPASLAFTMVYIGEDVWGL